MLIDFIYPSILIEMLRRTVFIVRWRTVFIIHWRTAFIIHWRTVFIIHWRTVLTIQCIYRSGRCVSFFIEYISPLLDCFILILTHCSQDLVECNFGYRFYIKLFHLSF